MPSSHGPVANNDITIIMTVQNFDEVNEHPLLKEYSTYVLDATLKIVRPSHETKKQMVTAIMKHHNNETEPSQASAESNCSFLEQDIIDKICPLLGSIGYVRELNQFFSNGTSEGIQYFEKPIPELVDRFRKYFEKNKEKFLTMLAVYSHDGRKKFPRMLQDYIRSQRAPRFAMNKHEEFLLNLIWKLAKENNMSENLCGILERRALEMEGLFLEESNNIYKFADKHVYSSFIVVLCENYSEAIKFCEEEFFFKCIKPEAGNVQREYLLVDGHSDEERLEAFMERLIRELFKGNVSKCMKHPAMSPQLFRRILKRLKRQRHLAWKVLTMQDTDHTAQFSCLVYGMYCQSTLPNGNKETITDIIIKDKLWKRKRKKIKWCHWTNIQENEAMIYAARMNLLGTFKSLANMGAVISPRCFREVIQMPLRERGLIIEEMIMRVRFTQNECLIEGHYWLQQYVSSRDKDSLYHLQSFLANINLNSVDNTIEPFLHRVVRAGDVEAVKILLSDVVIEESLDVNLLWNGETALDISESRFAEIASFLLQCLKEKRKQLLRTSHNENEQRHSVRKRK